MIVTYNSVPLQIERIIQCDFDPIYDRSGADYLYHHLRLSVRAVWHPKATSDGEAVAVESIANLTAALTAPRRQLKIAVPSGGAAAEKVLILSPLRDAAGVAYTCDAKNGPIPGPLKIVQIIGERMAIVDFTCESWINLCSTARGLVSHRWQMSHDINNDFWTTRTTTGEMIFRTDFMEKFSLWPDAFRPLIHPIPNGFQRISVNCAASEDGTALQYTVVDSQQPLNITSNRISRITGQYYEGLTGCKYDASEVPGSVSIGAQTGAQMGEYFGGLGAFAGGAIGAGLGIILSPFRAITFPTMTRGIILEAWGSPSATRMDVINALGRAAAGYNLGAVNVAGLRLPTEVLSSTRLYSDVFGKHARLEVSFENGSPAQVIALRTLNLIPGVNRNLPENLGDIAVTADGQTSNPVNSSGTRGEWLAKLWTQLLQTQCARPGRPALQANAANQSPSSL